MKQRDGVLRFLVDLGVFSEEDVHAVKAAQVGAIVRLLIDKKALAPAHMLRASELVRVLLTEANHTRKLKAQMSLMQLVTGKMHERMGASRDKIKRHKEKVTSGDYPVVSGVLAKIGGG